ncbi:MAG: hypothetical protein ACTSUO_09140, partial [Candidatus Thorarchaeota archaeon]
VLLPFKMVGELESRARNNTRSSFIQKAIRNRIDGEEGFNLEDVDTLELLAEIRYRSELPEWFLNQVVLVRKELEE